MRKNARWVCFVFLICFSVLFLAHFCSLSISTLNEHIPIKRAHKIIIDAGHGGEDGGASSANGTPESYYNLSIALKLEKLLHLMGHETKMVRQSDISVYTEGKTLAEKKRSDLKERVRIVNEDTNALLVSIHQNIFSDKQYHGAQVFYANSKGSKELADMLQSAIVKELNPGSNRKPRKASGIYLMEHIQRTGVLIECGFLSNPHEEALLKSQDYQKKLVCVIATTLKYYLTGEEKPNA